MNHRLLHGILALLFVSAVIGCGGDGLRRVAVSGQVTVDGESLAKGYISFVPTNDTEGPKAGGEIVDGNFEIPKANGPVIGDMRIEITEHQELSFDLDDPDAFNEQAVNGELPRNRIPPQYNEQSVLLEKTTEDGPNEYVFDLHTR